MQGIALGADHYGFGLKQALSRWLRAGGQTVQDVGCLSDEPDENLADYADAVCGLLQTGAVTRGLLMCGSGVAMAVRANRWPGVRAALCSRVEDVVTARQHNDINVLVLAGRHVPPAVAETLVQAFLETAFEPLPRRQVRLAKLDAALPGARP